MKIPQNLFFRVRDNGAAVFRIDTENRQRRMEFEQIATVNLNKGEMKPQNGAAPTASERDQIDAWIAQRRSIMADRQIDDIKRAIDHLNTTAQWVQSKATAEQIEEFADDLLLAMHDLRMVIVRKKSDALTKNK